jgi:hypothetical protein
VRWRIEHSRRADPALCFRDLTPAAANHDRMPSEASLQAVRRFKTGQNGTQEAVDA